MKVERISRKEKREVAKFVRFIEEIIERYTLNNAIISERTDEFDPSVGRPAFRRNFTNVHDNLVNHLALLKVHIANKDKFMIKKYIKETLFAYTALVKFVTEFYIDFNEIELGIEYVKDERIVELKPPRLQFYNSAMFNRFDKAMSIMRRLSYFNPTVKREFESPYYTYYGKGKRYRQYYHDTLKMIDLFEINLHLINRRLQKLNNKSFI